jgi:hypothetical protein
MAAAAALGNDMRTLPAIVLGACALAASAGAADLHFVIVEGLGGESRYEERFAEESAKIAEAARRTTANPSSVHVLRGAGARLDAIVQTFTGLQAKLKADDPLAVILIGHGAHDGDNYKFNIPGPDLTEDRLHNLLDKLPSTRQLVVLTTSSSGAALERLQAPGRVVITATKSGRERNATVFSRFWADAFDNPEADADKNEIVTVEEAYRFAEAKVKSFFEESRNMATEHPRMEGDAAGSFTLSRLGTAAQALSDPKLRPMIERREALQNSVEQLKLRKDAMSEDEYFGKLQTLLLQLAELEEEIGAAAEQKP